MLIFTLYFLPMNTTEIKDRAALLLMILEEDKELLRRLAE